MADASFSRLGHPHRGLGRGALQPDVVPQRLGLAARQRGGRRGVGALWPHGRWRCRIFRAMFDASQAVDLQRLPELFCGFPRRTARGPTLYPVACAPQAWAAGAVYLLLQACLGLRVDAVERRVELAHAVLPEEIDWLQMRNLSAGDAEVDLLLTRHAQDVGVTVMRRQGELQVAVTK